MLYRRDINRLILTIIVTLIILITNTNRAEESLFCQIMRPKNSPSLNINVRSISIVSNRTVTLSDIANIYGDDDEMVKNISRLEIASAPSLGKSSTINKEVVKTRINEYLPKDNTVEILFPDNINVVRKSDLLIKSEIETFLTNFIYEQLPFERDSIKIQNTNIPETIEIPRGNVDLKILPRKYSTFIGPTTIPLNIYINNELFKTLYINCNISVYQKIPISTRQIQRGEIIQISDIKFVEKDLALLPQSTLLSQEEVIGMQALRHFPSDSFFLGNQLSKPPLIKKRQPVIIEIEGKNFRITAKGQSLEDGAKGDIIKVVNMTSQKEIFAQVIEANKVKPIY